METLTVVGIFAAIYGAIMLHLHRLLTEPAPPPALPRMARARRDPRSLFWLEMAARIAIGLATVWAVSGPIDVRVARNGDDDGC
jgi:hypothetical protein